MIEIKNKVTIDAESYIKEICLSPDGNLLAVAGTDDPGFRLYQIADQKLLKQDKLACSKVQFSTDGKYIAYGGKNVKIIDSQSFKKITILKTKAATGYPMNGMKFYDDNQKMATVFKKKTNLQQICLWAVPSGELLETYTITQPAIFTDLDIAPNGKKLAATESSSGVRIYTLAKGADQKPKIVKRRISRLQYSPDGQHIVYTKEGIEFSKASTMKKEFKIMDGIQLEGIPSDQISYNSPYKFKISPNSKLIIAVVGGGTGVEDAFAQVWLLDIEGNPLFPLSEKTLQNGDASIRFYSICFSSDSTKIAVAKSNYEVDIITLA